MPTPIVDLTDAKSVADYRQALKGEGLNMIFNLRLVEVTFQYPSDPDFTMNFSSGDAALSPEKVAFEAIRSAMTTYCLDRITELDNELTSWNITY